MYKFRALFNGEISEIFGETTLPLDKFARTIGYKRLAIQVWETMSADNKEIYLAYASGFNDFVDNAGIGGVTTKLLPPEIYLLGIHK